MSIPVQKIQDTVNITFTYQVNGDQYCGGSYFQTVINNSNISMTPIGESSSTSTVEETVETITLSADENWTVSRHITGTVDDAGNNTYAATDGNGNEYLYFIDEESVPLGYTVSYSSSNTGIRSGVLTAINKKGLADVTILKLDGNDKTTPLGNAQFELLAIDGNSAGVNPVAPEYRRTGYTEPTGIAVFQNIDQGYYQIRETEPPEGYLPNPDAVFYIRVTDSEVIRIERNDSAPPSRWHEASDDETVAFSSGTATVYNEPALGNLTVTKELLGDVTGHDDKTFKITIKNSRNKYLQSNKTFADTVYEFTVSSSSPLHITDIPADTYSVYEVTDAEDVAIEGYLFNVGESTTSGTGAVTNNTTATVELKNYYDEEYTPVPSDTNEFTDLEVDKDWVKADGSATPAASDTIKFKVKVRSADAYIPVTWGLYDGDGTLNDALSGILYVEDGAAVQFAMNRFEAQSSSPGTSYWLNSNVGLTTGSGNTITPKNTIPRMPPYQGSGAWNQQAKIITFTANNIEERVNVLAQPYGESAKWVETPAADGERSWGVTVSGGSYYTNIADMRDALIDSEATIEDLVYTLDNSGLHLVENETTCSVRPETATGADWVASLTGLPTYLKTEHEGVVSYKVYSYEIDEIEVNGKVVTNHRTDDYIVSVNTEDETTTIINTEIKKTDVDASKRWLNADLTTTPPSGATVTFELFANGDATGKRVILDGVTAEQEILADSTMTADEKTAAIAALDEAESGEFTAWKAEWRNLPQYSDDAHTEPITYTVKEISGFAGYTNQNTEGISSGGTITNKQDTYAFDILKVDAESDDPLRGASFTIQQVKETSNTAMPEYVSDSSPSNSETTGVDGKTGFTGIAPGYYEVKETVIPEGYVITGDDAFYVKIGATGIKLLEKAVTDGKLSFKEAASATVGNVTISTEGNTVTFTVENTSGSTLPESGGAGTNLIYFIGCILTMLAGAGMVMKRRWREAE